MSQSEINVVTGAHGFTGSYITRRLLAEGKKVVSLTGHPVRNDIFHGEVTTAPFNFDNPSAIVQSMKGASTLFNTYWIRFPYCGMTFEEAVENSKVLIKAAKDAGVRRLVHISIANPSLDSNLPYYKGKAEVEKAIKASGISYAIVRPTVLFGDQGILINNIAWFLRRFPAFAVPGDGEYKLQPIFVEDLADLAVSLAKSTEDVTVDAVGPETFTFNDLLHLIDKTVHRKTELLHMNERLVLLATGILDRLVGDVIITPDEVKGLEANLLISNKPPTGTTRLTDWLAENAEWIGKTYMSEVKKHY